MRINKFIDLVHTTASEDNLGLFEAALAIKDDYKIEDEEFVELTKQNKSFYEKLYQDCLSHKLVKNNRPEMFDLSNLF